MAYVTAHAPHALRYFGVTQSLFDLAQASAQAAATGRGNAPPSPPPPEGWRNCDEVPGALARTASPPLAKAPEPKPAPAPEPAPEPAPAPEPELASEPALAPGPATAAKETKADGPTAAGSKGGGAEPPSAAVAEPPRPESLGKQGKKKSSMGSLFSALSPRSRRSSNK